MPPTAPFLLHRDTSWFPLLRRWAVALFLGCLASLFSLNVQASTVGTTVDFWSDNIQWNYDVVAVGNGVEYDTGAFRFDIDPAAGTFTIDVHHSDPGFRVWSSLDNRQFSAVFSGGNLGQFTSITRTGGTASDAASYSATASGKTLTFTVPSNNQTVAQGTIVFTFASTTAPPPSNNANLSGLALSTGVLSPAFTTGNSSYTAAVNNMVNSITVTPTPADANATVTVNGAPASSPVALNPGANTITVRVTAQDGTTVRDYTVTVTKAALALNASVSSTGVSCNGGGNGTATITPSGGVPPYTYSWSTGHTTATATGLSAGTYSVTVADRAASTYTMSNIAVSQPPSALTGSASVLAHPVGSSVTGSASVTPSGGTPGYTYHWTPSNRTTSTATGLAAGTHTVNVMDANSCQISRDVTLTAQPPTVQSVSVPANATYTLNQTLGFTVNYDAPITVTGTPSIALTIGGNARSAAYHSGSGSGALVFLYTVQPGDVDTDGIAVGSLGLNGGTLTNGGINAVLILNSIGATTGVLVNAPFAPTVTDAHITLAGGTGTSGAYKRGDTVSATWNNSASGDNNSGITGVTVNFSAFGGSAAVAANNTGDMWTASYTLPDGMGGTNRNVSVTATGPGGTTTTADTSNATVDTVAPTVTGIALGGSPGPADASVAFLVTFSETVTGVDMADFSLTTTSGIAAGTVSGVVGSGAGYTVTVGNISGNGSLRLDLKGSGTGIVDAVGNPAAGYAGGSVHTVAVTAAPGAPTGAAATAGNGQATVTFTAPASDGGSPITRYTATAAPGGATEYCDVPTGSPTGTVCPIAFTGLANGTSYTFTVKATNTVGTGPDSGASGAVVPRLLQIASAAGAVPGMAGAATATLSGGGTACTLQAASGFGPASAVPPQMQAPHGQFSFTADHCDSTPVTITLQYPAPLPANVVFRKPDGAGGWFDPQAIATSLGLTLSLDRTTVIYSIADNGLGDANELATVIADPLLPVVPLALGGGATAIPTLGEWALALLSALLGLLGWRRMYAIK